MNKYLVFRLEKWARVNVLPASSNDEGLLQVIYREPVYEDKLVPCFELVKEFELASSADWLVDMEVEGIMDWAREYSRDHGVRVLVVKGVVFGD